MKRQRTRRQAPVKGENFQCPELLQAWPVHAEQRETSFGQSWLYRLEVSLLAFYSCLLLITPAFSGLIRGRLPIEISTRGARFAEEAGRSAELTDEKVEALERATDALAEGLTDAHDELEQLRNERAADRTQPEVDSER